ncbi:MAG TPA: aminotransferase class I and II, partial [Ktedonobacteraceae bacterium]|nr:aminotransferase class I and II [Ktedonobacteraceae bacterium]
ALYFHHSTNDYLARSRDLFKPIKDHVLLPAASELSEAASVSKHILTSEVLDAVVEELPVSWLDMEEQRVAYRAYLQARLDYADLFVEEAQHARAQLV